MIGESERPLVSIEAVSKQFEVRGGLLRKAVLKAVENVSFDIARGETLGLVGESGSGKSTLGRVIVNLLKANSGSITVAGQSVTALKGTARRLLWRHAQMVFQDPFSSLNPRMTIRDALAEPLRNFEIAEGAAADAMIKKALDDCGMGAQAMARYPQEFSGGQRQRIGIARALILRPDFIVADEPVSALDVSIQAQIVNLVQDLQVEYRLTYLFIAHDLAVVRHIADRVAVMYMGRLVEIAGSRELYLRPAHPYTQLLLSSIPIADPRREAERVRQRSSVDTSSASPSKTGCPFNTRCPRAQFPRCGEEEPALRPISDGHLAACHFA
jgi:oligopeptide transport system ATP-binding protein